MSLCYQLDSLLNLDGQNVGNRDTSETDTSSSPGQVNKSLKTEGTETKAPSLEQSPIQKPSKNQPAAPRDVFEFEADSNSPSPPRCRRTRRATKQKKKKEFLTQTNTKWAIGKESLDADKCSSCNKSSAKRVKFQGSNAEQATRKSAAKPKAEIVAAESSDASVPTKKKRKSKTARKKEKATNRHQCGSSKQSPVDKSPGPSQAWLSPLQTPTVDQDDDPHLETKDGDPRTPQAASKLTQRLLDTAPKVTPRKVNLLGEQMLSTPQSSPGSQNRRRPLGESPGFAGASPAHSKRNPKGETPLHVAVIKVNKYRNN